MVDEMATVGKLLFSKDGVFIHTTVAMADEDALVAGRIFIWEKLEGIFIEWKALHELEGPPADNEWTVVDTVGYRADKSQDSGAVSMKPQAYKRTVSHTKYVINFDIKDLKSFKRSKPNLGWSYLIFILRCGTTFPALHFHQGGTKALIKELEKYLIIKRSPSDSCLYLVREHDPQALTKSFDELQLFEQHATDVVTKFMNDPYTATYAGFSKVTRFLHKALIQPDNNPNVPPDPETMAELLHDDELNGMKINNMEEPGYEMVTTRELPERVIITRADPLTPQQWSRHMDNEGRVKDIDQLKEAIFLGGVDPLIRIEVWKFILGYYPWDSTYKTRTEHRKKKVDDYFRMKLQWKSVSEEQEKRFTPMKDHKSLIDKDVFRTDRTHHFYKGEDNKNIQVLYEVLMTYCMYNFDLGYVQGMSDLLSPILVIMENEVDAFWCFAGFMELVCHNFDLDQAGMKKQLFQLNTLVKFLDPGLHNYLVKSNFQDHKKNLLKQAKGHLVQSKESQDSSNMYFCFRWLLIVFKREFSFPDIMRLWEVYWTGRPCDNYHLIMCLSILDSVKNTLTENNFGFTEILKYINDMSNTIDVDAMLSTSQAIVLQCKECEDLPESIREILGLEAPPPKENLSVSKSSSKASGINTTTPSTPDHLQLNGHVENNVSSRYTVTSETTTPDDDSCLDILPDNIDLVY